MARYERPCRPRGRGDVTSARPRGGSLSTTAFLVVILAVAALTITRGSYALWNATAPIASTTIVSGTLTATIAVGATASPTSTTAEFGPATWAGMLPGETRLADFTVANTGNTPFTLAASLDDATASNGDVRFAAGPAPCPDGGADLETLTETAVRIGPVQTASQALTYCLAVTLLPDVPASSQGSSIAAFTLLLSADQETP